MSIFNILTKLSSLMGNIQPWAALLSCCACFIICHFASTVGNSLGLVDHPNGKQHGAHEAATPLVGGLAILPGWSLALWSGFLDAAPNSPPIFGDMYLFYVTIIALTFLLIGMWDDRHRLSAWVRLLLATALYLLVAILLPESRISFIYFPSLGPSFPLESFAIPFTVLCMVALLNATNMCDGRNGLVLGFALLWLSAVSVRLGLMGEPMVVALFACLSIVFWFNYRGRLFLGDAGAYALATFAGLVAISVHNQPMETGGISSSQLATLFAMPAFDMIRLIVVRLKRGVSPLAPDLDHLHHRIDRRLGWKIGLPIYLTAAGLPMLLAFSGPKSGLMGLGLSLLCYVGLWGVTRDAIWDRAPKSRVI